MPTTTATMMSSTLSDLFIITMNIFTSPSIDQDESSTTSGPPAFGFGSGWSWVGVGAVLLIAGTLSGIRFACIKHLAKKERRRLMPYLEQIVGCKDNLLAYYGVMTSHKYKASQFTECFANMDKMRFNAVLCIDETRVREENLGFIHANAYSKFLLTQCPMTRTSYAFFSMLLTTRTECVVQLCLPSEAGQSSYLLVEEVDGGHEHAEHEVHATKEVQSTLREKEARDAVLYRTKLGDRTIKFFNPVNPEDFITVTYGKPKHKNGHITRKMNIVLRLEEQKPKSWTVVHELITGWPDKGICLDSEELAGLVRRMEGYRRVAVHCLAGIGRTATFALACEIARIATAGEELDIKELGLELRKARAGAIQNQRQYIYSIYLSLLALRQKCLPLPDHLEAEIGQFAKMAMNTPN